MKRLVLVFAVLVSAAPVTGGEPYPRYGNDLDRGYRVPMEIDRLAALLGDEVLREMVCRLSYERYAFGNLSSALGMPEGQVMRRINTLRGWGLVRMVRHDSAHIIVEPIPGDGSQTLRRWANRYCSEGDSCGKPVANAETRTNGRKEAGIDVGGPDSQVGGEAGLKGELAKEVGVGFGGLASPVGGEVGLKGKLITVFGGSGFVGRDLVKRLMAAGAEVRVAVRNPDSLLSFKSQSGAEQLAGMSANVREPDEVAAAVAGASMVVNLVGILSETGEQTFAEINEYGPRRIAEAAAEAKVQRFIHVSAISADLESESVYARTKAAGEAAAKVIFPNVTIVRPSLIFDFDGGFVKRLADMSQYFPIMPLFGGGSINFQPVYVGDVSAAIVHILSDPGTMSRTYELGGARTMGTSQGS